MGARSSSTNKRKKRKKKKKKRGWVFTRRMLEWFNYPRASAHPGCEVSSIIDGRTESTCSVASSVLRRSQPDDIESCIVLESRLTRSLVAKLASEAFVTCSMRISCCRRRTLRTWLWTGVCETLWRLKHIKTIAAMYVSSADLGTFDSLRKNLAWWAVTRRTSRKPQNCQNKGMGACPGQHGNYVKTSHKSLSKKI